ncbi:hypothetical protein C8R45DRAFT_1015033 [Mycena sanguinolenta]|nr:hypothetical protein C8R45DRAFT_1015033 [Mycena sanguinolenta]
MTCEYLWTMRSGDNPEHDRICAPCSRWCDTSTLVSVPGCHVHIAVVLATGSAQVRARSMVPNVLHCAWKPHTYSYCQYGLLIRPEANTRRCGGADSESRTGRLNCQVGLARASDECNTLTRRSCMQRGSRWGVRVAAGRMRSRPAYWAS